MRRQDRPTPRKSQRLASRAGTRRHAPLIPLLAVFLTAPPASAQEPIELEGLLVTAHRWAAPAWTVAAHATVIDGLQLERAGIERVADALRTVPGLFVARNGSFGATTSVFMRGGESDYVQVLIDGVPVNEPGGRFDFGSLTTDNIERIEVLRGPASSLYGSDAVSGVIQVFTRRGAGGPHGSLQLRGGSYGTREWQAELAGGAEPLSYAFSLGRNDTDGVLDFNNQHQSTSVTGRVELKADPRTDAVLAVRYEDRRFHFPTDGTGALVDRNAFTFGDALTLSLSAGRRWGETLETRLTLSTHESDTGTDDDPDGPADSLGFFGFSSLDDVRRTTADLRSIWRSESGLTLAAGFEAELQQVRTFSESLSQFGISTGNSADERSNRAWYGQLGRAWGQLALNGGLRLEDNDRFGTARTYRAGAVWRSPGAGTRIRASAGTAIKEPTFFENYATGFALGNPDLEPEESTSFEAGVDQDLPGGGTVSLTGFAQGYRNLIQFAFPAPVPGGPNFQNVAKARSRGVEAEARWALRNVQVGGGYTYLDTEVTDAGLDEGEGAAFVNGQDLLRRPRHAWFVGANLRPSDAYGVDVTLRRVGERSDRDFAQFPASPVTLPAHNLLDVAADVRVVEVAEGRPGLALTLRVDNLMDERYEELWGFRAPGRALYLGGRVTFGSP